MSGPQRLRNRTATTAPEDAPMSRNDHRKEAEMQTQKEAQPKAGRKRMWARFDLPVLRPSATRAKLARRLV
jgi:hypothetical protein